MSFELPSGSWVIAISVHLCHLWANEIFFFLPRKILLRRDENFAVSGGSKNWVVKRGESFGQ